VRRATVTRLGELGPQELEGALRESEREAAFWGEHAEEHRARYAEQFVAIDPASGEVLAAACDLQDLVQVLREKGFTLSEVWSRFVPADGHGFIL
jgi:phage terminase large subunit-like protein